MTAWRWWKAGMLLVPAHQTDSGTILVDVPEGGEGRTVVYARVSSHDQRDGLNAQVGRVSRWAATEGIGVDEVVCEVGSGVNGWRRRLRWLLADSPVGAIVMEHRDRLARFGVEHLEAALWARGRRVLVVDAGETIDDLVRDVVEVLTSMCARLYGRRGARSRTEKALRCAQGDVGPASVTPMVESDG